MSVLFDKITETDIIIKIQGEFDIKNCLVFKQNVLQFISEGYKNITVDLNETDYIDAPGIGILIAVSLEITKIGGEFMIINSPMHISDLLEATQAIKYLSGKK